MCKQWYIFSQIFFATLWIELFLFLFLILKELYGLSNEVPFILEFSWEHIGTTQNVWLRISLYKDTCPAVYLRTYKCYNSIQRCLRGQAAWGPPIFGHLYTKIKSGPIHFSSKSSAQESWAPPISKLWLHPCQLMVICFLCCQSSFTNQKMLIKCKPKMTIDPI